jgi:hypothetical protein
MDLSILSTLLLASSTGFSIWSAKKNKSRFYLRYAFALPKVVMEWAQIEYFPYQ